MRIQGLHHVTAITGDMQGNIDFYTKLLGLRLVKMTVNYDDPGSYHVYYGDGLGRPGTIITFFGWPGARRGESGVGQVTETAYAIPVGSADYWQGRLTDQGVKGVELTERFGQKAVMFRDIDGMSLALIELTEAAGDALHLWQHGGVAPEYAVRGFFGVTIAHAAEGTIDPVLVKRFGYSEMARLGRRIRYAAAGDAVGRVVDVVIAPAGARHGRMGAGEVHHVAFRTADRAEQDKWLEVLRQDGLNVSPVMDREYFQSIYFREPGGTLFEIATDGPGMTFNETVEALGARVMLPTWLESRRTEMEAILPPVKLADRYEDIGAIVPAKEGV